MPIAIGDIHGHARKLEALLKKTGEEDLIFLGDLVDRGPESNEVLAVVDDLVARGKARFILGNHEDLMCYALEMGTSGMHYHSAVNDWVRNNHGMTTIKAYGYKSFEDFKPFMQDHIRNVMKSDILRRDPAPLHIRLEGPDFLPDRTPPGFILVHAGFDLRKSVEGQDPERILWEREGFIDAPRKKFAGWPFIVHGHTPRGHDPEYHDNKAEPDYRVNLDGGTYLEGEVLAYRLEDGHIYSSGDEAKIWDLPGFSGEKYRASLF
jgi:serine/threonine protein phosphatase 1